MQEEWVSGFSRLSIESLDGLKVRFGIPKAPWIYTGIDGFSTGIDVLYAENDGLYTGINGFYTEIDGFDQG